jgi:metal-responsive CopG/Arc/MetJ family transcriptional regulator
MGVLRWHMVYHMAMARKEVLVQLDDELVANLDRIAAEHGISRSALLRRIASVYVEVKEEAAADARLIASYTAHPQDEAQIDALMRAGLETLPEW